MTAQLSKQPRFFADFDSGALNIEKTTFDNGVITLEPRRFEGEWKTGDFSWLYFQMLEIKNITPTFRIDIEKSFEGFQDDQRFVYSYDNATWHFFDHGRIDEGFYIFSNDDPFSEDSVYIAIGLPYPFWRIESHIARVIRNEWVSPTKSANSALVIGTTKGSQGGGYRDDLGRLVPPLNIYGYCITNPKSDLKKKNVILSGGNHCDETMGNHVLQGSIDFLLSDDPDAARIRDRFAVYVYPNNNPEGRFTGFFRSNPENPTKDHNRHWIDSTGFTDTTIAIQAMNSDPNGPIDIFLDYHGQMHNLRFEVYVEDRFAETNFIKAFKTYEPGLYIRQRKGSATGCRTWSTSKEGLNAKSSYTIETAFIPGAMAEDYHKHGEHIARSLLAEA